MPLIALNLLSAKASANVDIFTVPDDPSTAKKNFVGNIQGSFIHQSGNTRTSTISADSTLTWFDKVNAYSVWGEAYNYSSDNTRSSEKYQAGLRLRHNLDDKNFLFGQSGWLSDRFNGYRGRYTNVVGYGRQIFNGPLHTFQAEVGPGVRHDEFTDGSGTTNALAYTALSYSYKLTDTSYFIQGVSLLASRNSTLNSETGIRVNLNKSFSLKVTYNYTLNSKPPSSAPQKTDTKTQVSLVYNLP